METCNKYKAGPNLAAEVEIQVEIFFYMQIKLSSKSERVWNKPQMF